MASELDNLKVYGETEVGWDENTPPNEKLDGKGNVIPADDLHREDPFAPSRRVYDDPEVEALRDKLRRNNGMRGLDIFDPNEGFDTLKRSGAKTSNEQII